MLVYDHERVDLLGGPGAHLALIFESQVFNPPGLNCRVNLFLILRKFIIIEFILNPEIIPFRFYFDSATNDNKPVWNS